MVDLTSWAEAAGLQRGDRLVAFAGNRLTVDENSASEVWSTVPRAPQIDIEVERNGRTIVVRMPCRDPIPEWQALVGAVRAIGEGQWDDCLNYVSRKVELSGIAPASTLRVTLLCWTGKIAATRTRPADKFWRLLHRAGEKIIEESQYRPSGRAEAYGAVLNLSLRLDRAGRGDLADQLRQQMGKVLAPSGKPGSATKVSYRVGTGFVVRPDGLILTAFHVVKGATEIALSCPGLPETTVVMEQFSEANDLAVLRASAQTPTYLSIAAEKAISLGDPVFTIGYPAPSMLGGEAKFSEGSISSLSVAGDAGYMQISVPVHPGNSGGALANQSGDVVGVVVATASALTFLKHTGGLPQNVSWAVKAAFAVPLFDQPLPAPRTLERSAVIQRVQKATCSIRAEVPEVQ